ncbi:M14 family zinc carboxypeptidase [Sphaerisporangium sp. TRM90804]|uniref:M14 family zinc carboxypeptidase n=1 Tax=Sphaerisporangium sp. TRM90804 TaxID=3031113 RepID=UPI002446EE0C|nr:M14 family zinc carboxypeptidase [Sphaerisporangium sp. TRM90804]MDH2425217.1 M14 family zinc carboxypeptidase [Sphaerisporangium sp. TRM90804]
MLMRHKVVAPAVLALAIAVPAGVANAAPTPAPATAAGTCDPTRTPAAYLGKVPTPRSVLGFDLGEREVTSAESDTLVDRIDRSSDRVVSGTLATTAQGRPLKYAIVGKPSNVTRAGLAATELAVKALRSPLTPSVLVRELAKRTPAILWVTGNVHGNEESGADAALKTLYDLADRDDCAARRILDKATVVVLPVQNPDGREADNRRNAYGFDMNRDWFARTQPETDGKLEMLRKYPPQVYIDAHEQGGTAYFFPPNADPIYHDIAEPAYRWISELYGQAMIDEFTRRGIPFTNRDVYDLFYMGYGDTVPTTGFNAAGMTFEKGGSSPIPTRTAEQFLTQWVTLSTAAANKDAILTTWHGMFTEALKQGLAGELEPNQVYNPGNEVLTQVPDRPVRHYFLRADDPAKKAAVQSIVRRLQRMDVQVFTLAKSLTVSDFKEYGRAPSRTTLPEGTYWIPMAQGQKHWIQAMLNEDAYTPFPYFYDVTAWSLPLLANVRGGSSGSVLLPRATPAKAVPAVVSPPAPAGKPKIGVLQLSATSTAAVESTGWLRHRLDRDWKLPFTLLSPADVAAGKLAGLDVVLAPAGPASTADAALGDAGREALRAWVGGGGRYVGWSGGAQLASLAGISTATFTDPTSDVPGSLFRVNVAGGPLAAGVGSTAWQFYSYDPLMRASNPSHVVASYPAAGSADWFVSGFQIGAEELGGTAAALSEPVGRGHTVLFAAEPNFRAFTDGTARLLANAITAPLPADAGARARAVTPRAAPALVSDQETPIRVTVKQADKPAVAAALTSFGARWTEQPAPGGAVRFVVANPEGLSLHEHPWAARLPATLKTARVTPLAVVLP